jgi:hypothetical protein
LEASLDEKACVGLDFSGGLGGGADKRSTRCFTFSLSPSARTVDPEDDDAEDSRTEGSPCSSGVLSLATSGRPCSGLACRIRKEDLLGKEAAGECEYEDIDVGVEEMLKTPGDSEYRVDGVVDSAYCGAGGGSMSVGPISKS